MIMQVFVEKSDGSVRVPIPAPVLDAAGWRFDAEMMLDVSEEAGRIVIGPAMDDTLASLLAQITPENQHAEVDFGPACGHEAL